MELLKFVLRGTGVVALLIAMFFVFAFVVGEFRLWKASIKKLINKMCSYGTGGAALVFLSSLLEKNNIKDRYMLLGAVIFMVVIWVGLRRELRKNIK